MKYGISLIVVAVAGMALFLYHSQANMGVISPVGKTLSDHINKPTVPPMQPSDSTTSVFVPYWSLTNASIDEKPDTTLIYFGITPTSDGIDTDDAGYTHLSDFQNSVTSQKTLLGLRMTDTNTNLSILENPATQSAIISQTIDAAKTNNFSGIVLDLEISAIPFDSLKKEINRFVEQFYKQAKQNNLTFAMTMYGDTFYRLRPFDVKTLANNTDQIMIMAYDFHKANGDPGPNFPLSGKEKYGYDFKTMIDDFLQFVPAKKLAVIFGMYGYDWTVDSKNASIQPAKSLTLSKINATFFPTCKLTKCQVNIDGTSTETEVTYVDSDKKNHVVWFETMDSVKQKEEYLKQKGIGNISFWAYSYY